MSGKSKLLLVVVALLIPALVQMAVEAVPPQPENCPDQCDLEFDTCIEQGRPFQVCSQARDICMNLCGCVSIGDGLYICNPPFPP